MEEYRFLRKGETAPAGRAYVGHVSCPGFLRDADWMRTLDFPLTLVLPPLPERFFKAAMALVSALSQGEGFECSVNDFGALLAITERFPNVPLAAGPLLLPQDTDPLLYEFCRSTDAGTPVWTQTGAAELRWQEPTEACKRHWQEPSVFSAWELLRECGVSRLELCAQPLMPQTAPPMPVSVYRVSMLSVLPCRSCTACAALPTPTRAGKPLQHDKNLICYADNAPAPAFADRMIWTST